MLKRTLSLGATLAGLVAILHLTSIQAHSQVGAKNTMLVQGVTPGVSQSGHANISGTMRAGNFIGNGSGLTGITATGLTLPFSGSANPGGGNASFKATATGGGIGIFGVQGNPGGTPSLHAGIFGYSDSEIGTWGESISGTGVRAGSTTGLGLFAQVLNAPYAAQIRNATPNSIALFSFTEGTNGTGVLGQANGTGVEGRSLGSGGTGVGVRGTAVDTDGYGVEGIASATTGFNVGVRGESASTTGQGVFGRATNTTSANIGVYGWASGTSAAGVDGLADSPTGITFGVRGNSSSTSGRGVYGIASTLTGVNQGVYGLSASSSGYGVYGFGTSSSGLNTGVIGISNSPSGYGVRGSASSTAAGTSFGGHFVSQSNNGRGVYGLAGGTGTNYGAIFESEGTTGYGLLAQNLSTGASITYGVYGEANGSVQCYGGYFVGYGTSGRGMFSFAPDTTSTNYGVRGSTASPTGYGVFSVGDTGATGTKSFTIDHPEDPANKYLRHYSAEGPEPVNQYRGEITTDANGFAWVQMPSYYGSININETYHLTVIDDSEDFVMAKVTKRMKDGRFQIRTSKPNTSVCWEVKALRNDPWVQAHPIKVEYFKEGTERGKYQHPELYGQPKELGMDYDPVREAQQAERKAKAKNRR